MPTKFTEPEIAAELTAELHRYIQQGGTPFQAASVERSVESGRPDIVIWYDDARQRPFAFWELKRPYRSEDLTRLPKKAQSLGVRYAVVWNFQYGELYEIEGDHLQSIQSYPVPVMNSLEEWAYSYKRYEVVQQARRILDDLARVAQGKSLTPYTPDKVYFTAILQKAIHNLLPVLKEHLFQKQKDRKVWDNILQWAVKQGYPIGLPDLDERLARHWAYSLAVRVLFYFTIRRYHQNLPDLQQPPGSAQPVATLLYDAFSRAQAVDWQAVFELSPLDQLGLPPQADPVLQELLDDFHRYDFGLLQEDVVGQVMEGLIPEEERHALGQYFTREDLVDFILGFVADNDKAFYLDPTCGSGTFLTRLYSRLRWLSCYQVTHAELLERLWGVDIAHFPAELATINLFRQNVKDLSNFPRIVVKDFFELQPGQQIPFPPLKAQPGLEQTRIEVDIPLFHGIVGNFPYIRQELIERQVKGYKRQIVQAIARYWSSKDSDLFTKNAQDLRLSGQADIYAYLFYHAAAFLEEGGRLGIVTSNSWLDAAYGAELKRFFLRHFKIIAVVASWCEPWFEDAAVNTAFVILERCENKEERKNHTVRFVKVKTPLADLLPQDLLTQEHRRWQAVDALVQEILYTVPKGLPTASTQPLQGIHTVETNHFRIRLIPQAELEQELEAKGETAKWGLYIRAPQVYFDLLEKAGDHLVPLSQVAEVRRGYTTGINDFFYLEPVGPGSKPGTVRVKNARNWVGEMEEECLRPVIRSPREAPAPSIDPARLRDRLFLPPHINQIAEEMVKAFLEEMKNKKLKEEERRRREQEFYEQLRKTLEQELQNRYPLAYAYVRWGENQRTSDGRLWPEVPSVQGRRIWWLMPEKRPGPILMPMINDRRFVIFDNEQSVFADHNLFEFLVSDEQAGLCVALMNSTIFGLVREVISRVNLGEGATKTEGVDWNYSALLPNPSSIDSQKAKHIIRAYRSLQRRPVGAISEEIRQKDRQALDRAVLEALGLDPKECLPQIYQGLVEMVEERLALPQKRKIRQKQEQRISLEQIKEKVRRERFPGGLKPIAAFLAGRPEMIAVTLTGRPVSWQPFFNQFTLLDEKGKTVGTLEGDERHARFAIYAAKPGAYMVEVPADAIVAGKAVQDYEQYLRQEGQNLYNRLLEATRNQKHAERAAREILQELGLPPLGVIKAMGN